MSAPVLFAGVPGSETEKAARRQPFLYFFWGSKRFPECGMKLTSASSAEAVAAEEQQKDNPAAVHAAATAASAAAVTAAKAVAAATAAGQKQDDPQPGTAVASESHAAFVASASTVCSS